MINFIKTKEGISIFIEDKTFVVANDHANFKKISELVQDTSVDVKIEEIEDLVSIEKAIQKFSEGEIVIENGTLTFKGDPIHNSLSLRILDMLEKDQDVSLLLLFLNNLMENPSYSSINELYGFLEANDVPLTNDGHFLAYKKVTNDYKDLRTETFDNSVGKKVVMPRYAVDDDRTVTCSTGLHVAGYSYMKHYGSTGTTDVDDRVIICKVNPKDVVSVPVDYDNAKMRVCEYTVVGEIPNDFRHKISNSITSKYTSEVVRKLILEIKQGLQELFSSDTLPKLSEKFRFGVGSNVSVQDVRKYLSNLEKKYKLTDTDTTQFLDLLTRDVMVGVVSVLDILAWVTCYTELDIEKDVTDSKATK